MPVNATYYNINVSSLFSVIICTVRAIYVDEQRVYVYTKMKQASEKKKKN